MGACSSMSLWQEDEEESRHRSRERTASRRKERGADAASFSTAQAQQQQQQQQHQRGGTSRHVRTHSSSRSSRRHGGEDRRSSSSPLGAPQQGKSAVYRHQAPGTKGQPSGMMLSAERERDHDDVYSRHAWMVVADPASRQAEARRDRSLHAALENRRSDSPTPPHLIALARVIRTHRSHSPRYHDRDGRRSPRPLLDISGAAALRGPHVPPSPTVRLHTSPMSYHVGAEEMADASSSNQQQQQQQSGGNQTGSTRHRSHKGLARTASMSLRHIEEEHSAATFAALSRGPSLSHGRDSPDLKFFTGRHGSAVGTPRAAIPAGHCDSALSDTADWAASLPSTLVTPGTPALASWMQSQSGPMASTWTKSQARTHAQGLAQPPPLRQTSHPSRTPINYNPLFLSPVMSASPSARSLPQIDSEAISAALTSFQPIDISILLVDAEGEELESALLAAGYSVVLCEDALEAMSVLLQRPAAIDDSDLSGSDSDRSTGGGSGGGARARACATSPTPTVDFHLVIIDAAASTPQGFHLLDWLRGTRYTAHLPVLVSSPDGSIASTERWLRRGVADVLRKPHVPALALSTIFTLLIQRHQLLQLPTLQQKGDRYKRELQAHVRSHAVSASASLVECSSTAAPISLNVLVLSSDSMCISSTLLGWLGAQFSLNLIPCRTTEQVLHHLRQPRGQTSGASAAAPPSTSASHVSAISNRLIGTLGADLLLLDEMMLGDSDADREFAAAITSRPHTGDCSCGVHGAPCPSGAAPSVAVASCASLPSCSCLMVPLMLLADNDSSSPALSLLSLLQRSLVGVLEMPMSPAIVHSKLGAFLRAVEQHRRRFQLAQRANDYRMALQRMRSGGGGGAGGGLAPGSRPSVSLSEWRSMPSVLQLPFDPLTLPSPMGATCADSDASSCRSRSQSAAAGQGRN